MKGREDNRRWGEPKGLRLFNVGCLKCKLHRE